MTRAACERKVLFLCEHGGAKSVLAAAYFNGLARQSGLAWVGEAVASEEPYPAVVASVAALLEAEGLGLGAFTPRQVGEDDFGDAAKIVSIGCSLPQSAPPGVDQERWDDVPAASADLEGSARAIRRHVEALAGALRAR